MFWAPILTTLLLFKYLPNNKKKKKKTEQMTNLATQITPAPGCNIEPLATDAAALLFNGK